ncbi:EamA family transporter [Tropicibacter sp. R15_0]|uniref:EamA family transporter n=1 Tax=Tropicibacter sp. R15_0 TaxID=2821101 RepID=UPI001ADA200F|nr:EamA family transporter [Tropicibacter sp. R15_0]MBO9466220.1 EamA family transporter [Tropicibacter sp. R15_0]
MSRQTDLFLTALAPIIWGSSYIVSTEALPGFDPFWVGFLRALPAGVLLLVITRQFPERAWWGRVIILGGLNFAIFWAALFVAAYRLPGGVAATLGAVQPLLVLVLAHLLLGAEMRLAAILAALAGIGGVALLILGPDAQLDAIGLLAALIGAGSMALGTVLSRRWQPPVPPLTFAAWQLTAGGLLLLPMAWISRPELPQIDGTALLGLIWLSVIGAALTYVLFFRGLARLGPATISSLGFLSPLSAVLLGWIILNQALSPVQITGAAIILASIWAAQRAANTPPRPVLNRKVESRV